METIGDRVRTLRNIRGLTQSALAKKAGIKQSTITHLENGRNKDSKFLNEIAGALESSYKYLKRGSGAVDEPSVSYAGNIGMIPLISWVQAGDWRGEIDNHLVKETKLLPAPQGIGEECFALLVEGSLMTSPYPGIKSYPAGTIIYVDPAYSGPLNGKRVIAKLGEQVTFREYSSDSGKTYLKPLNPQYPAVEINHDCEIIGVVVGSYTPE